METKGIIKSLFITGLFVGAILLTSYQFFYSKSTSLSDKSFGWKIPENKFQPSGQVTDSSAYSNLRAQGGASRGLPVRLKIPIIGVDTAIEDAYITSDGRMDVPAGSVNVAWYALGPHPGQKGSAVIGGHFGIDNGIPKVFYNLNKLEVGDKIYVVDDNSETLAFVVRSIKLFGRNADAGTVFFSGDGLAHLNLITCEGVWNKVNDSYPDRRVVFTDAIPSEGNVVVNTQTMAAIIKPSLPATAITPSPSLSIPSPPPSVTPIVVSQLGKNIQINLYLKSLFSTPLDGVYSSFLIISILFMSLKILRR